MRIKTLIIILLFISCQNNSQKGFIDQNVAFKIIKVGMTKNEVIKKIGMPLDSIEMYNSDNIFKKVYSYNTNNFSGYSLKIVFDNKNIIEEIYMD